MLTSEQMIEMSKNEPEIPKWSSEEEAYRRGFACGFQVGIETQPENFDEMIEKIRVWRYEELKNLGAPGTNFEKTVMGSSYTKSE